MRSAFVCALCFVCSLPALSQNPPQQTVSVGAVPLSFLKPLAAEADNADTIEGEEEYAADLAQLLVGNATDAAYVTAVSRRLSMADRLDRAGYRTRIPEQSVAQAFNSLMNAVVIAPDTPPRASVATVHQIRTALDKTFPELTSVDLHPSTCLPTEAALLLVILIYHANATEPSSRESPPSIDTQHPPNHSAPKSPCDLLTAYAASHPAYASVFLFDNTMKPMGF